MACAADDEAAFLKMTELVRKAVDAPVTDDESDPLMPWCISLSTTTTTTWLWCSVCGTRSHDLRSALRHEREAHRVPRGQDVRKPVSARAS